MNLILKNKLEETMAKMQEIFNMKSSDGDENNDGTHEDDRDD